MWRIAFLALIACLAVSSSLVAAEGAYPNHPIKIYQGFPPGGNVDTIARLIGNEISKTLGQPVIVESRPGAGGNLAADVVAKAEPDGYSLLLVSASHAVSGAIYESLPFDPVQSFAMVSTLTTYPFLVLVKTDSPYQSLRELLDAGRAKPESIAYGSVGKGSLYHLATEMLGKEAGVKFLHVPYKGEAPQMVALLRGEVPFGLATPTLALINLKAGKVRALAVTGGSRWSVQPDIPTVAESGLPGYSVYSWLGLVTTAGTPPAVVERLNAEVKHALEVPAVRERIEFLGGQPSYSTPAQMRERVASDLARWKRVVAQGGIARQ